MPSRSARRRNKKSAQGSSRSGKIVLIVALLVAVMLGGGYLIQSRSGPPKTAVIVPELSSTAQAGRVLFNTHCIACHGENAAGTDKGPPLINDIYRPGHHGDYSFVRAAAIGVRQHHWVFGNMPPLPQVSKDEVKSIVVYVRELQRANGIH